MVEDFFVYEHRFANGVSYIGKGRLARVHAGRSSRLNSIYWVRLFDKYGSPSIAILAGPLDNDLACLVEIEAIAQRRALKAPLCNLTDGGEGATGRYVSAAERERMRDRSRAFFMNNPEYAKANAIRMAAMNSEPTRAKINADRLKSVLADPEVKARAQEKRTSTMRTDRVREMASSASKARWSDPEMREKIMQKLRGRDYSKLSPAMKALFADKNNHPRTDHTIYTFVHKDGTEFVGKRIDLCTTYGVSATQLSQVISGRFKSTLGWSVKKG